MLFVCVTLINRSKNFKLARKTNCQMQRDTADGISCSIRDGEGRVETTQGICVNISRFIETKKVSMMSTSLPKREAI